MEAQPKRCRRCLLQDMADENDYYASVVRYRATMPRRVRTPDAEYTARLEHCRTCPSLNAGTCMQCGCYVEMRAARTDMHCPLDNAPWYQTSLSFSPAPAARPVRDFLSAKAVFCSFAAILCPFPPCIPHFHLL